jgi:hypothetical protein
MGLATSTSLCTLKNKKRTKKKLFEAPSLVFFGFYHQLHIYTLILPAKQDILHFSLGPYHRRQVALLAEGLWQQLV